MSGARVPASICCCADRCADGVSCFPQGYSARHCISVPIHSLVHCTGSEGRCQISYASVAHCRAVRSASCCKVSEHDEAAHVLACNLLRVMDAAAAGRRVAELLAGCAEGKLCSLWSRMSAPGAVSAALSGIIFSGTMQGSSSRSTLSDSDLRLSGTSGMQGRMDSQWK